MKRSFARFLLLFAMAATAIAAESPPARPLVLPFIEDDYARALAQAKTRGRPIFLEAWAPWCHTCRSMRAFVFTDPALAPRADQFVWLSIDTEKKSNAAVLEKYPVEVWPSFFVVDPKTETAAIRWVGAATVPQLFQILDDGSRAVRGRERGVDAILADADRLYGQKRNADAAAAYRQALAKAPKGWKSRPRAVESLLFVVKKQKDWAGCAATARDAFPSLADAPSAANVAGLGLDCAIRMPADDPARAGLAAALAADTRQVLARPRADIAADDISSLYGSLADEREAAGDAAGRRAVLQDWAAFLEAQAARARTPAERTVFDSHRLGVYIELGEPQRAIPMLEASQEDFPDDYNPPSRLALAYEAMKDYEKALHASDDALSKAYGPRLVTLLVVRSRIYAARGDAESARIAMEEAIREAQALPPGQRSQNEIDSLRKKLEQLPPPGP
jgi:thiol-disulfide isomerase/thioredoxin